MNRTPFWQPIALFLATVAASSALAATPSNVIMTFVHPERLTDFRVQGRNEQDSAVKFAREMSSALAPTVARQAPRLHPCVSLYRHRFGRPLRTTTHQALQRRPFLP